MDQVLFVEKRVSNRIIQLLSHLLSQLLSLMTCETPPMMSKKGSLDAVKVS